MTAASTADNATMNIARSIFRRRHVGGAAAGILPSFLGQGRRIETCLRLSAGLDNTAQLDPRELTITRAQQVCGYLRIACCLILPCPLRRRLFRVHVEQEELGRRPLPINFLASDRARYKFTRKFQW